MFVQDNSVGSVVSYLEAGLSPLYPPEEVNSMVAILFAHFNKWNRMELRARQDHQLSESELLNYHQALKQLKQNLGIISFVSKIFLCLLQFKSTPLRL